MSSPRDPGVLFLSGVRTGFGAFGGALKDLSATDLGAVGRRRAPSTVPASSRPPVDHVVFGNVLQTSADAPYLARHVGLRAAFRSRPPPHREPAVRLGLRGRHAGRQQIRLGESRRGAGRRHRVDEPGAARGARRPLGPPAGPAAAARGPALGGAARRLLRARHGGDRGAARGALPASRASGGLLTPRGARPAPRPRGTRARSPTRSCR